MNPENQQQQDHDLLLTLSADVRNGFANIRASIEKLENGLYLQINDHERRIKKVEDMALKEGIDTIRQDMNAIDTKIEGLNNDWGGFRASLRVYTVIAGFIGAFAVWVAQQTIIKIFFK